MKTITVTTTYENVDESTLEYFMEQSPVIKSRLDQDKFVRGIEVEMSSKDPTGNCKATTVVQLWEE